MWSPVKYGDKPAWRVEEFLGLNRSTRDLFRNGRRWRTIPPLQIWVILDDANLGFRDQPELWPAALNPNNDERPWIFLKMAKPLARGRLRNICIESSSDHLIVVATVDDLRLSEVQISRAAPGTHCPGYLLGSRFTTRVSIHFRTAPTWLSPSDWLVRFCCHVKKRKNSLPLSVRCFSIRKASSACGRRIIRRDGLAIIPA